MISYLERRELVLDEQEPDFIRILHDPATKTQDIADMETLIPIGETYIHKCNHDLGGNCSIEKL